MFTVEGISEGNYKDKGSRFIAMLYPVNRVDEISAIVAELWERHRDARHVCYAYKIDNQTRENDDGEPGHTAGSPIMRQIQSANLNRVAIFVVRYFGGIKLGVSGLIQAYGTSAQEAIANAKIIPYIETILVKITFDYPVTNHVKYLITKNSLEIEKTEFDTFCVFWLKIPKSDEQNLSAQFLSFVTEWEICEAED